MPLSLKTEYHGVMRRCTLADSRISLAGLEAQTSALFQIDINKHDEGKLDGGRLNLVARVGPNRTVAISLTCDKDIEKAIGMMETSCLHLTLSVNKPVLAPERGCDNFWKLVAMQYPVHTAGKVKYFNTAGLGPANSMTLTRVTEIMLELQSAADHGHSKYLDPARKPVADFMGAQPEEICFIRNASEGTSIVATGLDMALGLREDDEVIFDSHAHPGGSFPWMNLQMLKKIKVKIFEPDHTDSRGNVEAIRKLITPRTKAVQVSHITCTTGLLMPVPEIAALCKEHNIWFHVDGAQSIGMVPVHVAALGCDSYACSTHKWVGAPHGTGVLWIKKERLDDIPAPEVGAYSNLDYSLPDEFSYNQTAVRYEYGTRSASEVQGIAIAMQYLDEIGMANVAARGQALAQRLRQGLLEIDGVEILSPETHTGMSTSILTFRTSFMDYSALFSYLFGEHQLRLRPVQERGLDALRAAPHIFNSEEEIDLIVAAVRAARELSLAGI